MRGASVLLHVVILSRAPLVRSRRIPLGASRGTSCYRRTGSFDSALRAPLRMANGYSTPTSRMVAARRSDCSGVASTSGRRTPPREVQQLERFLDENGVRRFEQSRHERHQALVGRLGGLPVTCSRQLDDLLHASGRHVADGGDDSGAASLHDVERGGVVAGVHDEAVRSACDDGLDLIHLARRLLHGHDVVAVVGRGAAWSRLPCSPRSGPECCTG